MNRYMIDHLLFMKTKVKKLDKDLLISARYDRLISRAIQNLEVKTKLNDELLSKTSTRRLKKYCADISGAILNFQKALYCISYTLILNHRLWSIVHINIKMQLMNSENRPLFCHLIGKVLLLKTVVEVMTGFQIVG